MSDTKALVECYQYVKDLDEGKLDMNSWGVKVGEEACGTTACLAGHKFLMDGGIMSYQRTFLTGDPTTDTWSARAGYINGEHVIISEYARRAFKLDSTDLFYSVADLEGVRNWIVKETGVDPELPYNVE